MYVYMYVCMYVFVGEKQCYFLVDKMVKSPEPFVCIYACMYVLMGEEIEPHIPS